jgi:autotransporter-associated beta strand protein
MDGDYTTTASFTLQGTGTIQMAAHNLTVGSLIAAGSAVINNSGATKTLTVGSDNTTTSYYGVITNNIQLTKTGTGFTELWGANTYSGGTTISNGLVLISNATGYGSGTVTVSAGGVAWLWAPSALTISNNFVLNGSSGDADHPAISHDGGGGLVTLNGTITLNGSSEIGVGGLSWNQMVINGVISGTGALTIDEANASALQSLKLNGANTFTGGTIITGGTLQLGNTSALAGGAVSLSGSGILDLNGYNTSITDITSSVNTATIIDNSGSAGTTTLNITAMNHTISCLIKDGTPHKIALRIVNFNAGFLLFPSTNANTFSGGLTLANSPGWGSRMRVTEAITTVGSAGAITSSPYGTGTIYIGESATDYAQILFDYNANTTLANAIVVNTKLGTDVAGAIRLDNGGHTLSGAITANLDNLLINGNNAAASITLSGQITGSHDVVLNAISGNLTVTLANAGTANSYTGATTIGANCTLLLGASNQIPNGAGKGDIAVTGSFSLGGFSETINGITGAGTIEGSSGTPTITVGDNNTTTTYSGTIQNSSGTLSITKIGSGTITFSGGNNLTYDGATSVSAGTLKLVDCNALANGSSPASFDISSGATLEFNANGTNIDIGSTYASGTVITGTGTLKKTGGWNLELGNQGSSSYKAYINMTGGLIDIEAGTLYNGGWQGGYWSNNKAGLYIASGAFMNLWDGNTVYVDALTGAGTVTKGPISASTNTIIIGVNNGSGTFTGIITETSGNTVAVTKQGSGTQTLSGTNTYTGTTTINGGTILVTGSINNSATNTITVNNTGILNFGFSDIFGNALSTQLTPIVINSGGTVTNNGVMFNSLGPLTLNGGTLTSTAGGNAMWPSWALKGTVTVTANSTISASGTWSAIQLGDGASSTGTTFNVASGVTLQISAILEDGRDNSSVLQASSLTKTNTGTVQLMNANTYTGATTISAGTLVLQDQYATPSFAIASGATLELNRTADLTYTANTTFTGAGTLKKTGAGTILWADAAATFTLSSGALIDVEGGDFRAGYGYNEVWTNNLSDLTVASGAVFECYESNVIVDALNGAGLVRTGYLGASSFTVGADNGTGTFSGIIADEDTGSGHTGAIIKTGSGSETLSGANSYSRTTTI